MDWISNNVLKINSKNKDQLPYLYIVDEIGTFVQPDNLPKKNKDTIRLILISDTHDKHHLLNVPAGDLLIHCGDIVLSGRKNTDQNNLEKYIDFNNWIGTIDCPYKIVIGGNHDYYLEKIGYENCKKLFTNCNYFLNELVEFKGYNFFISPFSYGDSNNKAFQSDDYKNKFYEKLNKIGTKLKTGPLDV